MLPIKTLLNRSGIAFVAVFSFLTLINCGPGGLVLGSGARRKHQVASEVLWEYVLRSASERACATGC